MVFYPCRHVKKPEQLGQKADMTDHKLESFGKTLHTFQCKKCGKRVAEIMDA